MKLRKVRISDTTADAHFEDYLKTTYLERLIWLEKVNLFRRMIKNKKWQKKNS